MRPVFSPLAGLVAAVALGLAAGLAGGGEARAQSPCPAGPGPGEVIIGETDAGGGMRVPLCAQDGATGPDDFGGGYGSGPSYSAQLSEAADAIRRISEEATAEMQRRGIDLTNVQMPEDERLGRWMFASNQCAAAFVNGWGAVSISSPGEGRPGVLLTFWNGTLPKPAQMRHVQINMAQSDSPRQRVRAISYYDANLEMGGLVVAVPSVDALLDNMPDVHNIKIWIGDEPAVNQDWQAGHAARDRLRTCFASRRG